jgi:hypothetical protein
VVLKAQDGMGLLKAIRRLCNQYVGGSTGLMEIVTLEHSLALNVQGRRSKVDYLRSFKVTAEAINLAGEYADGSTVAANFVAKDQKLS